MTFSFAFWTRGLLGLAVILGVVLLAAMGGTHAAMPPPTPGKTLPDSFKAPAQVRLVLERACLDCHSEQTEWPWYSHIPPISWHIHNDVEGAREFMNLSEWSGYTPEERRFYQSQIARATRARIMPPQKYLWMHHNARLSDADLKTLEQWAK